MRRWFHICFVGLLTLSSRGAEVKPASRVSVLKHPEFAGAQAILQQLVDDDGKHRTNHLYVSPTRTMPDGCVIAWVFWHEERLLVLWEPFDRKHWRLRYSRSILNLDKDVVPTRADIGGSTSVVDAEWACNKVGDCVKNGDAFTIYKQQPKRRKSG